MLIKLKMKWRKLFIIKIWWKNIWYQFGHVCQWLQLHTWKRTCGGRRCGSHDVTIIFSLSLNPPKFMDIYFFKKIFIYGLWWVLFSPHQDLSVKTRSDLRKPYRLFERSESKVRFGLFLGHWISQVQHETKLGYFI